MSNFINSRRSNGEEVYPPKSPVKPLPQAAPRDEMRVPLTLSANKFRSMKKQTVHTKELLESRNKTKHSFEATVSGQAYYQNSPTLAAANTLSP